MDEFLGTLPYRVSCCDGAEGLLALPKGSIKLVYGSPPYPNAERNYGVWRTEEYESLVSPSPRPVTCTLALTAFDLDTVAGMMNSMR